ncbi:MAG: trypsin-like peptidase domain-containing protein [Clostridia bacterium]|nr:trypsin-like peptidase domain-containing protein [Clostridia bacterium]
MDRKKEIIKDVLIGVGFAVMIVLFVITYVNYREVQIASKVYVNYVPESITVNGGSANDFVTAVDNARKSVVEINATLSTGTSAGSGVIYASDGSVTYIVTNFHVIENATSFKVILYDGTTIDDVQLVGGDEKQDIAVLLVKGTYTTVSVRQVAGDNAIKLGETVFAIGNPLGQLGGSVTKGIISCLNREIKVQNEVMNLMQTDVAINSGNSGGGLFDINGNLIGIVNAKVSATGVEGIAFAISIDNATSIADELIETHTHSATTFEVTSVGYIAGRTELGFEASYTALVSGFFVSDTGLFVTSCDTELQAYASGLRQYDKIVSILKGGVETQMNSNDVYLDFISELKVGDKITLNIVRNSTNYSIDITVNQKIYQI